ncbi:uncharacterized protein SOCE26_025410 [Sorangium cellulosum]|uniref:Uncharacterized protein n=1 Tax=Sorangium cellulosum TaxID=56 RepID=A0A2L0EPA8_SORCE|nr:uncharacterized protein SOCE26_025410 [Sorangium cellulosum]
MHRGADEDQRARESFRRDERAAGLSDKARWKALRALARGGERKFNDGPGATLLDAHAVKAMAAAGKTREFCDLVVQLLKAFLAG